MQPAGESRPAAAQQFVSEAGETAVRGPVPVPVGLAKLRVAWPRRGRGDAAPGTHGPAGKTVVGVVKLVLAPRATAGRRGRGAGVRQGCIGLRQLIILEASD